MDASRVSQTADTGVAQHLTKRVSCSCSDSAAWTFSQRFSQDNCAFLLLVYRIKTLRCLSYEVLIHDHSTVGEVFLFIAVTCFVVVFVPHMLFANKLMHFYTQKKTGCPPTTKGQNERVRPYFFFRFFGHYLRI